MSDPTLPYNNDDENNHNNDDENIPTEPVKAVEEDEIDEIDVDETEEDMPVIQLMESCHIHQRRGGGESNEDEDPKEEAVADFLLEDGTVPREGGIPEASLVHTVSDYDVEEGLSLRIGEEEEEEEPEPGGRAEFIGVVLALPSSKKGTPIGIRFVPDTAAAQEGGGGVVVTGIEPGSLLSFAPVKPGDKLLSVNGKPCTNSTPKEIAARIRQQQQQQHSFSNSSSSSAYLNLVFRNEDENADPNLIESMLTKLTPTDSLGVKLATTATTTTTTSTSQQQGGEIRITDIVPHGITDKSLLNVGDTLLRVNDHSCENLTTQGVAEILRNAPQHVRILVRPGKNSAVVVAEVSSRNIDRNIPMATANPPTSTNTTRGGGRRRRRIDVLVLVPIVFFLIVMVAGLGFSVSQRQKDTSYNDDFYNTDDYLRRPCTTNYGYNESSLIPYTNRIHYAAAAAAAANDTAPSSSSSLVDEEDGILLGGDDDDHANNNRNITTTVLLDDDDDHANDNRNITTLRFQFIGHFNVFPLDVTESPTDEQVNHLLEKTSVFFAEVLEEEGKNDRDYWEGYNNNSTTPTIAPSSFWSLRMVFNKWEHHWCSYNYESNVQVFTTLEVGLTNVSNNNEPEWILVEKILQILQSSVYSNNDYIGTILWNIPTNNIFHHTYYVRWDDTSLWWT